MSGIDASIENDLATIRVQEDSLIFPHFDEGVAWELGNLMHARAASEGKSVVIDIRTFDRQLFFAALPGTSVDNSDWVRGKVNVVRHFQKSSYAVGLSLKASGASISEKFFLPASEYRPHGGCFPVRVNSAGIIGTITVSGLPQREDHKFVVGCLMQFLNVAGARLELA